MFPFVKTGGLADATSALPQALERGGASTNMPCFRLWVLPLRKALSSAWSVA
ncbi:glycogen/starch synthase [Agrobacterium fabrum]|uniref:glycogen/starch synthase n=1 Tax=Agrobacterium fabrum TaxID=1176649 RepID=UPI00358DB2D3